ncbi:hypothetical protein yinte0001_40200 [Yersinia intermedia ATCC 29909]|nr:hypothetical protein yinte0001_40200 [Yersinia intermedia ATCC 29909]
MSFLTPLTLFKCHYFLLFSFARPSNKNTSLISEVRDYLHNNIVIDSV